MSIAFADDLNWIGTVNTPLVDRIPVTDASPIADLLARVRVGSAWTYLVYSSNLSTLTGMTMEKPVLPHLLVALEGTLDIAANEESPLVQNIHSVAAESRSEDAADDGRTAVSPLAEELALKVAARLVAADHVPQSVGVTGEGRIAFGWADATQAVMITVGDNGRVRLSSKVGLGVESSTSWGVAAPIPGHCLALLNEYFDARV